jgi:hypothetical protein
MLMYVFAILVIYNSLQPMGVTTALDMAMWSANKMNSLRWKPPLPDNRSAGQPATAADSLHSCMLPLPEEALVLGPEHAEASSRRESRKDRIISNSYQMFRVHPSSLSV